MPAAVPVLPVYAVRPRVQPGNLGVDRGGLDGFLLFLFLNLVGSVSLRFFVSDASAVRPS